MKLIPNFLNVYFGISTSIMELEITIVNEMNFYLTTPDQIVIHYVILEPFFN